MITIKEIAQRANVSRTTVSRVLNDSGYISDEVRQRVLKVIEETGYVPSEHAKSLRTKRTKVIGVILPKISTETSSRLVAGIDLVLADLGYQILLVNTNHDETKELEGIKLLKSKHVDGIILSATNVNDLLVNEMNKIDVPLVVIGQDIPGFTSIVFNDYEAAKDSTRALIEKGHKRIAYIGVDESDPAIGYWRKKGYIDALDENKISYDKNLLNIGLFDVKSGYKGIKQIITKCDPPPTALLAVTDRIAIGALKYLVEMNYSIPEDFAIIGMGASEMSQYVTPSLTTVDFNNEEAGRIAATELVKSIKSVEKDNYQKILTDYRLIKRNSL